ncbi:hypothetical protein D9M72_554460 [compost metagenome]
MCSEDTTHDEDVIEQAQGLMPLACMPRRVELTDSVQQFLVGPGVIAVKRLQK